MSEVKSTFSLVSAIFVLGLVGSLFAIWAILSLTRVRYASALVVACFAIFAFGLLAVKVITATRKVAPRVGQDAGGLTLRPDWKADRLGILAIWGAFAGMLFYAIFAPLGWVDLPGPTADRTVYVVMSIAGVLIGLPSLWRTTTQRGISFLRLTPNGFETGDAYSRVESMWTELSEISDRPRQKRWFLGGGSTYVTTSDGRTRTIATDWYTPDGRAVRELMRLYWQHPEERDELADGRAAERLAAKLR